MRMIFGFIHLSCIIISGFLIVSIPFVGIFKVFSFLPGWVYTVLFLGVVIPFIAEDGKQQSNHEGSKDLNVRDKSPHFSHQKIDSLEAIRTDQSGELLRIYPQLIAVDNDAKLVGEFFEKGKKLGYIKLCQERWVTYLDDREEIIEVRRVNLSCEFELLQELIKNQNLKIGSLVSGRINRKDSLIRYRKDQMPIVHLVDGYFLTFDFEGRNFPVYSKYVFEKDLSKEDERMTYEKAKLQIQYVNLSS